MTRHAPEHVYEAVARDRYLRWGYDVTVPDDEARLVAEWAAERNLREDADIVWRLATGGAR